MADTTQTAYTQSFPGTPLNSGFSRNDWAGPFGEQVVSDLLPKYAEMAIRGKLFIATSLPAGNAIPVNTTTAPTFFLWNPADSGVFVIPLWFKAGFASGTGIAGAIGYNYLTGAGGAQGTATTAVVTAITDIRPVATVIGGSYTPRSRFATTATIVTATSAFLTTSGVSQGAPITSTAASWTMVDVIDGSIALAPGTALYPVANTAIAEVTACSMAFIEIPYGTIT